MIMGLVLLGHGAPDPKRCLPLHTFH